MVLPVRPCRRELAAWRSTCLAAVYICIFIICCASTRLAAAPDHEIGQFQRKTSKGVEYGLVVPESYRKEQANTALVLLHGSHGEPSGILNGWQSMQITPDWIVIAPSAEKDGNWDYTDVARVVNALEDVRKSYSIRRTFVAGHSRGGGFSLTVALAEPDHFAGALASGGNLWSKRLAKPELADRVAIAIVHSQDDSVVEYWRATDAQKQFADAGWKKLLLKTVNGFNHGMAPDALREAAVWLSDTADPLKSAKEHFTYGKRMYDKKKFAQAQWAFTQVYKPEHQKESFHKEAGSLLEKIAKKSESAGAPLVAKIQAGEGTAWVKEWVAYDDDYAGTPFHAQVRAAHDAAAAQQEERASALFAEADQARAADEVEKAIKLCLEIRDKCPLASGEGVVSAQLLLTEYREDPAIAKQYATLLAGTEKWASPARRG